MSLRSLACGDVPQDLKEFEAHLERFDWFSHMSDDFRYWEAGEAAARKLQAFLKSDAATPEHKRCYNKHHAQAMNTPSFVTKDRPYQIPYPDVEPKT
jgi:hypothetical protein